MCFHQTWPFSPVSSFCYGLGPCAVACGQAAAAAAAAAHAHGRSQLVVLVGPGLPWDFGDFWFMPSPATSAPAQ
uniref:Uncharacterized protein n=1 Tax=Arundo donax TaxID=35708 RepID=A0A0A8YRU9_ARUDO